MTVVVVGYRRTTGLHRRMAVSILVFICIGIMVTPSVHAEISCSSAKILKQILKQQRLAVTLQQDDFGLLLNATHNSTAQLQIANLYAQNAMVEQHNLGAHLIQELQNK